MSDTSPQRRRRHRGDLIKREPGRAIDLRESDRDKPCRLATWARALAAVVLLDPSALPDPGSTATQAATQRHGTYAASMRAPTDRDRSADPASDSVPGTDRAVAGRDVPTMLAFVDAAAALIEAGDDDSAFLLLTLAEPAPDRPAGARDALGLLSSARPWAAACVPPGSWGASA